MQGVALGCALPALLLLVRFLHHDLGANPVSEVLNQLGLSALILLTACLTCTPLRALTGWAFPVRIRKTLGLAAYVYAVLHFVTYVALDQQFGASLLTDFVSRPFIVVGLLAVSVMTPLAFTSTKNAVRRMGFTRWKALHRLTYLAGALAVVHFVWRVKSDVTEPWVYGAVVGLGLGVRAVATLRKRSARGR